jgi:transposase
MVWTAPHLAISGTEASMENDSTVYVGLDVHKESITVAYALGAGEVELPGKTGTTKTDIDRLCKRLQSKARHVRVVYEAGPCGYGLYRQLVEKGFDCMVCAPSLIPRKPGERVKTDRRDAVKLVRCLRAGDLSAVCVPTVEDEAFRDLARAWMTAKDDLRQARQRLKSFLLAHGVRYAGHADWGPAHRRWVSQYAFGSEWQQFAFEELRRTIEDRLAQCQRVEGALREAVTNWRFYPAVLGLQAMRGVQFATAVGMLAELGDLSRFEHPRQLMAWLGVTPSEHSSGDKRRQGSITKTGNSYARKLLVEAAWSYRHPARVSPDIQRRHEGIPKAIIDRAWDAQVRLCRRYRRLAARGKHANTTVVAVARELSGFIWDIGRLAMSLALPSNRPTT